LRPLALSAAIAIVLPLDLLNRSRGCSTGASEAQVHLPGHIRPQSGGGKKQKHEITERNRRFNAGCSALQIRHKMLNRLRVGLIFHPALRQISMSQAKTSFNFR